MSADVKFKKINNQWQTKNGLDTFIRKKETRQETIKSVTLAPQTNPGKTTNTPTERRCDHQTIGLFSMEL